MKKIFPKLYQPNTFSCLKACQHSRNFSFFYLNDYSCRHVLFVLGSARCQNTGELHFMLHLNASCVDTDRLDILEIIHLKTLKLNPRFAESSAKRQSDMAILYVMV